MDNNILFEDVVKVVNNWLVNNQSIFEQYGIDVEVKKCDESGHGSVWGQFGDYFAELICENSGYEPYRYIMFYIFQWSMGEMLCCWYDEDENLEEIENSLNVYLKYFIDLGQLSINKGM